MKYDIHPVAALFPLIEGEAFAALVADIKANGLLEPIEFQGNTIIDGRNRLRACEAAGVVPQYHELPKTVDPVTYILQRNIHRRHLTTAQRAAIAAELPTAARGGNRNPCGSNQYKSGREVKGSFDTLTNDQITIEQSAELLSVGVASVKRAKARMKDDPEAHAAVKRGEKPKKHKEDDDMMRNTSDRRLWRRTAMKAFESITGKLMGRDWIDNHVKPFLCERAPWLVRFHSNKNMTEDQENEIKLLTIEFANLFLQKEGKSTVNAQQPSTFAMVESAQAEAEAIKQEIALPEKNKLQRAIKAYEKLLDLKLEQRIKQHMDEILPMYAEEYDRYKAFNDTYSGVFTDDEYRTLISVLHPDRCQPERATQFAKAFHLIKSKEEVLCKVKPNDRPTSLPSSLDELIARRVRH